MYICVLTVLVALSPATGLFAASLFDPGLQWKSIKTEHFWVHYHQGLEEQARRAARYAEERHPWLTGVHNWQPRLRTDIVLVDNTDLANGFAMPFPYNRVQLFVVNPPMDSFISNFSRWDEQVFTHEYTHILNLDIINGLPSCTRRSIGRFCFPGMFMPIWALEGNAVNYESLLDGRGRNYSAMTDMVMRMECAGDRFKSISLASHYPREWPSGNVPYLYGGLFVRFIEEKYGKHRFARVFEDNSDNIFPYLVNRSAVNQFGPDFVRLWREWESFLKARYDGQMRAIRAGGLTSTRTITAGGYRTTLPRFGPDGKWIAFVRMDASKKAALMKYSLETNAFSEIGAVNLPSSISIPANGAIYSTDLERHRSFSLYKDVYSWTRKKSKLTAGGRLHYMDVSRSGDRAATVRYGAGRYSLELSDTSFRGGTVLIDRTDMQLGYPRFSPDGRRLVFTLKNRSGVTDLVLYDDDAKTMTRLMSDRFDDITPSWHPDGERLLFSSDRTGVYNIYEYRLADHSLRRISNVAGGAFHPDVSPDGATLVMTLYGPGGFDIALADYPRDPPAAGVGVPSLLGLRDFSAPDIPDEDRNGPGSRDYSPLRSIAPPLWVPMAGSDELYEGRYDFAVGFILPGADTLFRHSYFTSLNYFTVQKRLAVRGQYRYSCLYPDIQIEYENEALFPAGDAFPWTRTGETGVKRRLDHSGGVSALFPLLYYHSFHAFTAGYFIEEALTDIALPYQGGETRIRDRLARLRASYLYSSTRQYDYSISKEDGREFVVFSDIYNSAYGSDLSFFKGWFQFTELFRGIGANHVTAVTFRGGLSKGNPAHLAPFPLGRFEKGEWKSPPGEEDGLGMRGYPSGALYGNRLALGIAEYRFPLARGDIGYRTIPFMFRNLGGTVFAEYGNVWNGRSAVGDFRWSAGMEFHLKITAGYYMDLSGYAGFARGFNRGGEDQFYFGFATLVEGALKAAGAR